MVGRGRLVIVRGTQRPVGRRRVVAVAVAVQQALSRRRDRGGYEPVVVGHDHPVVGGRGRRFDFDAFELQIAARQYRTRVFVVPFQLPPRIGRADRHVLVDRRERHRFFADRPQQLHHLDVLMVVGRLAAT